MVHKGVYATLVQFQQRCGDNVSGATAAADWPNEAINGAEGLINAVARKVFAVDTTAFALLPASTQSFLGLR